MKVQCIVPHTHDLAHHRYRHTEDSDAVWDSIGTLGTRQGGGTSNYRALLTMHAQFITCKEGVQTAHRAVSSDDPPAKTHHPPVKEQDSYSCKSRWSPYTSCEM